MARKTSADLRVELAELSDSAQAILDVARDDNERALTAEEQTDFDDLMSKITDKKKEVGDAETYEAKRRELAELRSAQSQPTAPIGGLTLKGAADRLNVQHRLGPIRSFQGQNAPRDAHDCGQWLKAIRAKMHNEIDEEAEARCASRNWSTRMVATEGSPTAGGYLVPTPMSNAIIDVRALAGVSRQICRVMPMTADTLSVPKKTGSLTVAYPGEAGSMASLTSDQSWGQIQLTAKKRAILSYLSQELRDDALIAIVDDLVSQIGTDLGVKEDAELVNGDGTSTYGGEEGLLNKLGTSGIYTPSNGTGKSVWSGLAMVDFTSAMAKLPSRFQARGPVWLASSEFYYTTMVQAMASAGGNNIQSIQGGPGTEMFLGRRVFLTDQMPRATAVSTVSALYGVFSDAVMLGDRMGIAIKQSEHARFAEDLLGILATARYDFAVHEHGDNSSTPGAYVGLKTAAS